MNDAAAVNRRLIEQAEALVPVLRQRAAAAEQARRSVLCGLEPNTLIV